MAEARLVLGCGIELLRSLPDRSAAAVVTDPPFGVGFTYKSFDDTEEAVRAMAAEWLPEAMRVAPIVAFTPGKGSEHWYPPPTWTLGWASPAGQGMSRWGFQCYWPVLVYGADPFLAAGLGGRPDTLILPTVGRERLDHPCPKPLRVWRWLVERVDPTGAGTIVDPFTGSGTTRVVCRETGRPFIGAEIEPAYHALAVDRIKGTTAPLFTDPAVAATADARLW